MDQDQFKAPYTRTSYSKDYLISFASRDCCRGWPQGIDPLVPRELGNDPEWRKKPILVATCRSASHSIDLLVDPPQEPSKVEIKQQLNKEQSNQISELEAEVSRVFTTSIESGNDTVQVSDQSNRSRTSRPNKQQQHKIHFVVPRDDSVVTIIANSSMENRDIVPASPKLHSNEEAVTSKDPCKLLDKFLTCEDVEEYLVTATADAGEATALPRTSSADRNNVEFQAASEHILSLLHPKGNELGESELLDKLLTKSSISSGMFQGCEKSIATTGILKGPTARVQHDTVDSLRTSVDRGGGARKLKHGAAFEPTRELKVECNVKQNSSKGEENTSDPTVKDLDTALKTESFPPEVKNAATRKTFKPTPHIHQQQQQQQPYNTNYIARQQCLLQPTQQQLLVPASFFWQAMPPLAWQPPSVVVNSSKLTMQPLIVTTAPATMFTGFPTTSVVSPPLVPQALHALQRLVDHQLDILNSIPGEVTPGMLHQRLSRSIYETAASIPAPLPFNPSFIRHL